ncbi:hypothetical protein JCM33374_g5177 [Metschnikowia sp. JCM 33374]|nr:hypothetical protein JCM33374_g5177 [Metschnikowia sp. JCM 33374]
MPSAMAVPHLSIKLLPKRLASTPTTAVSDQSMAYGTTTSTNPANHGTNGSDMTSSNTGPAPHGAFLNELQPYYSNATLQSHEVHHVDAYYPEPKQNVMTTEPIKDPSSSQSSGSSTQPVIITTDEKGLTTNSLSQPKGKLKVSIIGARDLLVSDYSQPYVVSTYESSEFVNNATPSLGKSPMPGHGVGVGHGVPMGQPKDLRPAAFQRQESHLNIAEGTSNPVWNHEAVFDRHNGSRCGSRIVGERVTGSLQIKWKFTFNDSKKAYGPEDFDVLRLLGKGTFGQVYQVRNRDNGRIYAMKILSKKLIVKKKEIAHTIGERNILVRTSAAASPFIVGLKFSFQTVSDLYLVTDYMSGGELFWHLQKEGRFGEERAKFYIAELVLALEHLHDNDIVYRDLKPENILLDANGHISLCDFGLSKANLNDNGTTNTFCGTTEYLAPEVLLDETGYTKMVDFWSLGVLIFEMCCGWSPFYADNTQQMYKNIAFGKVRFPKEVLSAEGRSFVKGLLNRNPKHRLGAINDARELKEHPFFQDVDWKLLRAKNIPPPFKPHLANETDTSNFDPEFTNESTSVLKRPFDMGSTPLSPGIQANFKGFTYVDASAIDEHFNKSVRYNTFKNPASFIPGNPNLPPDDQVIEEQDDDDNEMDIDHEQHLESEEFVNGRFDL